MHNLDDMIERYRRELIEFSGKNCDLPEEQREIVPAMTQPKDAAEKENQFESSVEDFIEIRPYRDNDDFETRNGSQGILRVQVFAADRSFPVSDADVVVTVPFLTGRRDIFKGKTDSDGIIDNIPLPAPSKNLSLDEDNTAEPFSLYNIRVSHPNFAVGEYTNVPVFDSVKSIQPVELVPLTQNGIQPQTVAFGGEQ